MGDNLVPNGLSRGCRVFQVEVAEIIGHEADEPNAFIDLLDSEFLRGGLLAGKAGRRNPRPCR
jgi:hypothetical protein